MKDFFKAILFISLIVSCQSNPEKQNKKDLGEKLLISYSGDADLVEFKMLGGLQHTLTQDSITCAFEGTLEVPNLDEAIFTYVILVHKKDSLGRLGLVEPNADFVKLNNNVSIKERDRFLWIGKNRNDVYLKNEELTGTLITSSFSSTFLEEDREVTIYTPKDMDSKTPHIYFTDGSVVQDYAYYVDQLIAFNRIRPIKLIGIHSSLSNRYEEYVMGVADNTHFKKHHDFFHNEIIVFIENENENWEGKNYLYGVSNGAAFCMHAGLNHPDVFEEIIAFSTADYISSFAQIMNPIKFKFDEYPKFYLGAGRYETTYFKDNINFFKKMKGKNIPSEFKEFISGHDYAVWRIEFLEYLENRFKI